jgi:hypothetical protein
MTLHLAAGCGGRQRKLPKGGAAKGMPLKEITPASVDPWIRPAWIETISWALQNEAHTNI